MSTLEELKAALRDTLAARGTLGQIQARVRSEIFNALEETEDPKPPMSHENLVINELIREYLEYNNFKHTLSVLLPETGQPAERIDRSFLSQDLNVRDDAHTRQIPLLYTIVGRLQHEKAGGGARRTDSSSPGYPGMAPSRSPQRASPSKAAGGGGHVAFGVPGNAGPAGPSRGTPKDVRASRDPDPIVM
uniref:Centrosomal protein 20 n=2 Tax=Hemiselmis andersenii TaxID=464988 RepID=A0A6U4WI96_HEMAN|mmetsp:Transcript_31810/g.77644  ORF Transcript_31810/g.77644 Transcript_31810/m.77644 type:complete len:190 (+) Transcript_31810:86-655(+)